MFSGHSPCARCAGHTRRAPSRKLQLMPSHSWTVARRALVCLAAAVCWWAPTRTLAQERPWSVSPCELLKNPGMYTEALVSVPGLVLYGPDQFTSHGYDCADENGALRLVFGGNPSDPKDRFRLPQARLEDSTVPLKKDADYETMQRLCNRRLRRAKPKCCVPRSRDVSSPG